MDADDALAAVRRGDREGLAALWRAHHPALLRFLRGRGAGAPEDVASQVWIEVARGLDRFEGDAAQFPRWLFTIARRRAVDDLRRQGRRPDEPFGEQLPEPGPAPDPADRAAGLDWALSTVRRLPPQQAEVVLLRVVAGLDVAEVAAVVGLSEGAVRVACHRGLQKLKDLVTPALPASMDGVR